MERAAKAVRRSGIKLLSLGGGHSDLNMVLSEQKDAKNTAKAFMAAQNSAAQYLMKWAANENNRAVQDVSNQIVELNLVWTETQREFTEQLKEFKQMFEFILEGEKHVDQAKHNLATCEQREGKIKKELKKAAKHKAPAEELRMLENRLIQSERQKDLALLDVEDKIRENEAVKHIRFKEGVSKLSNAYVELGRNCVVIFGAQRDIAHQLPDVMGYDLEDIKYTGSGATKHYVLQAKERIRQFKRRGQMQDTAYSTTEPPPPYSQEDYLKYPLSTDTSRNSCCSEPTEEEHKLIPEPMSATVEQRMTPPPQYEAQQTDTSLYTSSQQSLSSRGSSPDVLLSPLTVRLEEGPLILQHLAQPLPQRSTSSDAVHLASFPSSDIPIQSNQRQQGAPGSGILPSVPSTKKKQDLSVKVKHQGQCEALSSKTQDNVTSDVQQLQEANQHQNKRCSAGSRRKAQAPPTPRNAPPLDVPAATVDPPPDEPHGQVELQPSSTIFDPDIQHGQDSDAGAMPERAHIEDLNDALGTMHL